MELNLDWRKEQSGLWKDVSYELRPLRVWAFQALLDLWSSKNTPQPEDRPGASLTALATRIFPEHVRNLEGLVITRDQSTGPATPADLAEEAVLLPLASEIISRLVSISEVEETAEKK
ncbi:MAG: hypothetical protein OEZ59_02800 [Deltaproteobacteria bacterium]|nr:hypothetical protein [Deltaproteobacteria bacterium]